MSVTVKVEGLRELERNLAGLTKAAGKGALRRALRTAAEPMADIARQLAPDDESTGGYDLRESIVVGTKLSRSQARKHRKMFRDNRSSVEMFMGAGPLPQAIFVEFGTDPHINKGKFAGSMHPGTPARPFIRPAWDQDKMAMLERLKVELRKEIDKSVQRAIRKQARQAARR
ncbi:MAG: HK97-gp10 family putative phage morphogenesis protein [Limimaricola soesokkakensis]|uniref:HK97-gp10 family putative phage morphogenesis protein n=1 Tax=Limimaricola soesokkakensis TaxID=1343159 RepID=UPI00405A2CDA